MNDPTFITREDEYREARIRNVVSAELRDHKADASSIVVLARQIRALLARVEMRGVETLQYRPDGQDRDDEIATMMEAMDCLINGDWAGAEADVIEHVHDMEGYHD